MICARNASRSVWSGAAGSGRLLDRIKTVAIVGRAHFARVLLLGDRRQRRCARAARRRNCAQTARRLFAGRVDEARKRAALVLEQVARRRKLGQAARLEHNNFVIVDNGVDAAATQRKQNCNIRLQLDNSVHFFKKKTNKQTNKQTKQIKTNQNKTKQNKSNQIKSK